MPNIPIVKFGQPGILAGAHKLTPAAGPVSIESSTPNPFIGASAGSRKTEDTVTAEDQMNTPVVKLPPTAGSVSSTSSSRPNFSDGSPAGGNETEDTVTTKAQPTATESLNQVATMDSSASIQTARVTRAPKTRHYGLATTAAAESARRAAQEYLNDERFSDFTVVCDGRAFKVHRCYIALHSKYFESCCAGMFQETTKKSVELKEDLFEAVDCMIAFSYCNDYDDDVSTDHLPEIRDPMPVTKLQMNAYVYALADKYQVPPLKAVAHEKFRRAAASISDYSTAATEVLRVTYTVFHRIKLPVDDLELKETMIDMWIIHGKQLLDTLSPESEAEFFNELPEFGRQLSVRFLRGQSGPIKQSCKHCHREHAVIRATVETTLFRCFNCNGSEIDELVADSRSVKVKKYW